jgi:hypothetical protein
MVATLAFASTTVPASAADPVPPFIQPTAPWLNVVNYYRAMAKLPAVTENPTLSAGAFNHSCYMLFNGISHDEIPGLPGYTVSGDNAGNRGNVAVSSVFNSTARSHIELWMTGPFHAIGVLRHNLRTVGFGKCDRTDTSPWKSGATLNIIDGLDYAMPEPTAPVLFPANGMTTNLNKFITESPNPLDFCGWTGTAGLPVIALMPEPVTSATASITGPTGPLQTCRIFGGNTSGVARDILNSENAVSVIPRNELLPGKYTVTVTTQARTVSWSFTVDPTAATGIMPIPTATPAGPVSKFNPITPFRFADSRVPLRITKVLAGTPKRIKVAGIASIPSDTTSISANFAVTGASRNGFLSVYSCSATIPNVSTLNFTSGQTASNTGLFPLAGGDLCVYSPAELHLIIDINGYTRTGSSNMYNGIAPKPVVNTATNLGASGHRPAASELEVKIRGTGFAVPSDASAVLLNIAGVDPTSNGYVTAYTCGTTRPTVASVNAVVGSTRQNTTVVPISADGTICFYTHTSMGLRVEVLGYFSPNTGGSYTPANPARLIDTRDLYRPAMNFGLAGARVPAGTTQTLTIAGARGVPSNATDVSLNVTMVPSGSGTVTVWSCDTSPNFVSMTFFNTSVTSTGTQVKLSGTGSFCIRSSVAVHIVIDLNGYWT